MITKENLSKVLECLGFEKQGDIYSKHYDESNCDINIDFENERIELTQGQIQQQISVRKRILLFWNALIGCLKRDTSLKAFSLKRHGRLDTQGKVVEPILLYMTKRTMPI